MTGVSMTGTAPGIARRFGAGLLAGWLVSAGVAFAADAADLSGAVVGAGERAAPPPGLLPSSLIDPPAAASQAGAPSRNSGPAARAHARSRRGRHGTTRVIRRTPEVMREDAARVRRGDLFSTWSNQYLE
jgi:hypothetical protein